MIITSFILLCARFEIYLLSPPVSVIIAVVSCFCFLLLFLLLCMLSGKIRRGTTTATVKSSNFAFHTSRLPTFHDAKRRAVYKEPSNNNQKENCNAHGKIKISQL